MSEWFGLFSQKHDEVTIMLKKLLYVAVCLPALVCAEAELPDAIKVPGGHQAFLSVHAQGEQIYQCQGKDGGYLWQIQAPDARLYDDQGRIVGKHYEGPVWEYREGSRVQGKILARFDKSVESAIAWLLVEIVGHRGHSVFAETRYIQRINTQGGLPPDSGCDGNHLGREKRVAYTADYVFYRPAVASR